MYFTLFCLIKKICFPFRTSRNVHLMNVQYMKLGVVYSYNIVFWKPIHQMIFSSTHWALCICDNDRNYRIYTLLIVEHYISFHGTPWKNIIRTTQTKIFPFHNGKIIKYIYFQKPKSLLKEVDGKLWIFYLN